MRKLKVGDYIKKTYLTGNEIIYRITYSGDIIKGKVILNKRNSVSLLPGVELRLSKENYKILSKDEVLTEMLLW